MTKKLECFYHTADAVEMQEVVYKKVSKSNSPPRFVPFTHGHSCVKIRLQPAPLCRRGALPLVNDKIYDKKLRTHKGVQYAANCA